MDKCQLRKFAKSLRARISEKQRENDADSLMDSVICALNFHLQKEPIVGTYSQIGTEIIPPHELPSAQMALPMIRDKTTLEFYEWSVGQPLVKHVFDISIPDIRKSSPVKPNIVLLPLLLCDMKGNRIGYGAGHYDRYIASCDTKPLLVGLCFDEQIFDHDIPAEQHDQKLDLIITPRRVIEIP